MLVRSKRLNIFEPGIELEERQARAPGQVLKLTRVYDRQTWLEELTVTSLCTYDETSGIVTVFAITGRPPKDFDPYRESGQYRTINVSEIEITKRASAAKAQTRTKTRSTKSFVAYAEEILRKKKAPMHVKDITAAAQKAGLVTNGATPTATMAARLGAAPDLFMKLGKGMFELKHQ